MGQCCSCFLRKREKTSPTVSRNGSSDPMTATMPVEGFQPFQSYEAPPQPGLERQLISAVRTKSLRKVQALFTTYGEKIDLKSPTLSPRCHPVRKHGSNRRSSTSFSVYAASRSSSVAGSLDGLSSDGGLSRRNDNILTLEAHAMGADVARFLIGKGADVRHLNARGESALMNACEGSNTDLVRVLLESNADLSVCTPIANHTALERACFAGDMECVTLLLDAGCDIDFSPKQPPLLTACRERHLEIARLLVRRGALVSTPLRGIIELLHRRRSSVSSRRLSSSAHTCANQEQSMHFGKEQHRTRVLSQVEVWLTAQRANRIRKYEKWMLRFNVGKDMVRLILQYTDFDF